MSDQSMLESMQTMQNFQPVNQNQRPNLELNRSESSNMIDLQMKPFSNPQASMVQHNASAPKHLGMA